MSLRHLIHYAVFPELLCESSKLCNDHPFEHAPDCPKARFEDSMQGPYGGVVHRAIDKLNHIEMGIHYGPSDLTCEEARALVYLKTELQEKSKQEAKHG